jgi:hypothetical protein
MNSTIYMQWLLLRAMPRYPRRTSAADMEKILKENGIDTTRRTIERTLCKMLEYPMFAIDHDDKKPRGWFWSEEAALLDMPGMDHTTALTFSLACETLSTVLPRSAWKRLKPYHDRADELLRASPASKLSKWPRKVRILQRGQPLVPAEINEHVMESVYRAVFEERMLKIEYLKAGQKKHSEYQLSPLGLVIRGPVINLIAMSEKHANPAFFLLHRFKSAEVLEDKPAMFPTGFNLDRFLETEMGVRCSEEPINLRLKLLTEFALRAVTETPLTKGQKVVDSQDGLKILEVKLNDTLILRGWILSFGDQVEVLEPETLRSAMKQTISIMASRY